MTPGRDARSGFFGVPSMYSWTDRGATPPRRGGVFSTVMTRSRTAYSDHRVGDPCDRGKITRIVRQIIVLVGMAAERRTRRVQQDVVVLGADEGVDGDDTVA